MSSQTTYDFVIIGSGPSGGRLALDLVSSGARCLLLEAGREFSRKTFPGNELDYSAQMFWGGGVEISSDGRLGFLRARCLGGTSIVNQALLDRFDDVAWDDWRAESGVGFFRKADMEPIYEEVERELSLQSIPESVRNRNAKLFIKAFDDLNYHWKPLRRGQKDCALDKGSDCIVCLGGCPRDSKQSSLVTTIAKARAMGLVVESQVEIRSIDDSGDSVRLHGIRAKKEQVEYRAAKVVLAAGSLGNTGILMRSGYSNELPALGKRFSCHPQFMTYAYFDEPVDAHKGAFQSVASNDNKLRRRGYKYENVYAPPIGTAMLMPGMGRDHLDKMKKYRYLASMEIAVRDENAGEIRMDKQGQVKVHKPLTDQDRSRLQEGIALVHELFEASGAKQVIRCDQGFGLHLMGGCVIGTDPANAVVNPEFQIYGHPRLFAADSSVFPNAPGINPSLTVMTLSHYASKKIIQEAK